MDGGKNKVTLGMLGEKILTARKMQGLTIAQLAEIAELSKGHISQIERNRMEPSLPVLRRLATALDIPMNVLFDTSEKQGIILLKKGSRPVVGFEESGLSFNQLTPAFRLTATATPLYVCTATIPPDTTVDKNTLPGNSEAFIYVLQGRLYYQIGDHTVTLDEGDSIYVPNNTGYYHYTAPDAGAVILWGILQDSAVLPQEDAPAPIKPPESMDWKVMGEKIRKYRMAREMKISDLAAATGISSAQISRIERDLTEPSMPVLRSICQALSVDILTLLSNSFPSDIAITKAADRTGFVFNKDETIYHFLTPSELGHQRRPTLTVSMAYIEPNREDAQRLALHPNRDELMYVHKGSIEVVANEKTYRLEEGDSIFVTEDTPHAVINHCSQQAHMFSFIAAKPC